MVTNRDNRSMDEVCTLHSRMGEPDDMGNLCITNETVTECFCAELPTHSAEFHAAGQHGIRTEKVLELDAEGYDGQVVVDYKGNRYRVYRTYPRGDGRIELYMTEGVAFRE